MIKEERTLLHIDLSGRVPYDTILKVKGLVTSNEEFGDAYLDAVSWYEEVSVRDGSRVLYDIADVRPYLRSISSMTEEEKEELRDTYDWVYSEYPFEDEDEDEDDLRDLRNVEDVGGHYEPSAETYDWYNRKGFDYRGLIPKGLALEAKEGMYN